MKFLHTCARLGACTLVFSLLTACGGSSPQSNSPPTATDEIEGIATPSSVAVVTATNAD